MCICITEVSQIEPLPKPSDIEHVPHGGRSRSSITSAYRPSALTRRWAGVTSRILMRHQASLFAFRSGDGVMARSRWDRRFRRLAVVPTPGAGRPVGRGSSAGSELSASSCFASDIQEGIRTRKRRALAVMPVIDRAKVMVKIQQEAPNYPATNAVLGRGQLQGHADLLARAVGVPRDSACGAWYVKLLRNHCARGTSPSAAARSEVWSVRCLILERSQCSTWWLP